MVLNTDWVVCLFFKIYKLESPPLKILILEASGASESSLGDSDVQPRIRNTALETHDLVILCNCLLYLSLVSANRA